MQKAEWVAVDHYLMGQLQPRDPVMEAVLRANQAAGLPQIDVSEAQGKFLRLLVRITGARRVLEVGTLGGYSTIWMAQALPKGGRIVTLEYEAHHAAVARANIAQAGLSDRVDLRVGAALDSLPGLAAEGAGPFDLVFIDADKPNNPGYLDWALRLTRKGGVIIVDNVVRGGEVTDASSRDPSIIGTRRMLERMAAMPALDATALQTVGAKGWDGFVMAVVG